MSTRFWLRRFFMALVVSSAALFVVKPAKGDTPENATEFAALWGALSATVFILVGYIRRGRDSACMLPREPKP